MYITCNVLKYHCMMNTQHVSNLGEGFRVLQQSPFNRLHLLLRRLSVSYAARHMGSFLNPNEGHFLLAI